MLKRFAASLVAGGALLAPAPAAATDVFPYAHLPASNGYRLGISGYEDEVTVDLYSARDGVAYTTKGTATGHRLRAQFGELGRIDLRFEPQGKPRHFPAPPGCRGRFSRQRGVWTGTVTFTGEAGLAHASGDLARGAVSVDNVDCNPLDLDEIDFPSGSETGANATSLDVFGPKDSPWFQALRLDRGGQASFFAALEQRDGAIEIQRYAYRRASRESFRFNRQEKRAAVKPPPPFSGSARYDGEAKPAEWTGDLSVTLPGAGQIALTGPEFKARISRGTAYGFGKAAAKLARAAQPPTPASRRP